MIQSPSVEVIRVERSRKESRNRAVLDLEEMKEDEQSIRGDQKLEDNWLWLFFVFVVWMGKAEDFEDIRES